MTCDICQTDFQEPTRYAVYTCPGCGQTYRNRGNIVLSEQQKDLLHQFNLSRQRYNEKQPNVHF